MKVTNKLFLVALLLSLILSVGVVVAQDNITFEQSNVQDVSIETSDSQSDEELPPLSEKDSLPEDDENSVLSNEKLPDSEDENILSSDVAEADLTFSDIQNLIDSAEEGDTIYLDGKKLFWIR